MQWSWELKFLATERKVHIQLRFKEEFLRLAEKIASLVCFTFLPLLFALILSIFETSSRMSEWLQGLVRWAVESLKLPKQKSDLQIVLRTDEWVSHDAVDLVHNTIVPHRTHVTISQDNHFYHWNENKHHEYRSYWSEWINIKKPVFVFCCQSKNFCPKTVGSLECIILDSLKLNKKFNLVVVTV